MSKSKEHSVCFNAVADNLALVACEIPRKFEIIAVQGHPSSSILVSIESRYATSY